MKRWIAGALALSLIWAGAASAEPAKVKIGQGVLVGEQAGGIASFRGVPFAAAPVGDLRWKPPQPAPHWSGERAASAYSANCMQRTRPGGAKPSEDCLYLNVQAPAGAKGAPVMVWIHGGSNTGGSGAMYDSPAFAKDGVVMVTINYRLGPFGFFAHPAIRKAAGANEPLADYSLMDQLAALKWVQANIKAFGGDPKRVTVFGESAGAIDIYALLGLKGARGLFSQAIVESNITWGDSAPLAKAEADGQALAVRAGASPAATLAELKAIRAEKLATAQEGALFPIVDGRLMSESSLQAMANGHTLDVPLIVGSNSWEAWLRQPLKGQDAVDWTNSQGGAPARFIAAKSAGGKPAWLYFFSYVATEKRSPDNQGAPHAGELYYVFDGQLMPPLSTPNPQNPVSGPAHPSDEDKAMAATVHACWVSFAKTGTPRCGTAAWPTYDPKTDQLMEFGSPSAVRTHFRKAALDAAQAAEPGAR
ncbi:carboxylesterase/lipase family protein [Phenylobacterium sp.]|uniref:carboxylesterase/lipase family protein n=1 Tax=Phenylobacterium sp. TaxID=1871053 RepID=UPI002DEAD23F|nr:carboxylesterase family protein [Phenylobacterium sp.]